MTTWQTIPELVLDSCSRHADRDALVDGDVHLTHAAYLDRIRRAAAALIAMGVRTGDRVAVWAPNCWEWPVVALGAHLAGAVVVPVNTRYKGAEADQLLARSGARVLFTVTDFLDTDYVSLLLDRPAGERADLPELEQIVVLRGAAREGTVDLASFLDGGAAVTDAEVDERARSVGPDDLCHLMFTSGTTGTPKAVMLAHGPVVRAYDSWAALVGLRADDRYLIINPYFHSFGFNAGVLACLTRGALNLPQATFDVPEVMRRVAAEGITALPGPPAIYQTILNHPDLAEFDLSSLRLAVTGAAAIPVELVVRMREVLGFDTVVTAYGLTEASGIATVCDHDDDPETIATTSGKAIPDVEVVVVGPDGTEVTRGEPGEVLVRGYNVMRGYFGDPEATAEAVDGNGWLHTGDIGVMDERGYLRITDRLKDMFIVGGFNAYPAEIEALLGTHPQVAQAAVIGVPDERLGEVGMAFVVSAAGTEPDPDEVVAWCRERMANFKVPRRVEVLDALPLVAAGKVDKNALRTLAATPPPRSGE